MKKRLIFLFCSVMAIVLLSAPLFLDASAQDKLAVVYLKDGGTGDGSSPDKACGDLNSAYDALDLSKDCTVVICGVFTQEWVFVYGDDYSGSVTFTSVYGGVDYRTSGAVYKFDNVRFVCFGATWFENMDFQAINNQILIIGQCNPIGVLEGVTMAGDASKFSGGSIAKAFCLLGGYQNNQSDPPFESDEDTYITALSGSRIYIVPFSREILGTYTGTAHIKIGGNADIFVLHGSSAYPDGIVCGDVKVEISGNANIRNFYGCTQNTIENSFELTWKSGKIGVFEWVCSFTPGKTMVIKQPTVLKYTEEARKDGEFSRIAALFDKAEPFSAPSAETTAASTTAAAVTAPSTTPAATAAAETTTEAGAAAASTPDTGTGDYIYIILSAVSLCAAVVILLKKRIAR